MSKRTNKNSIVEPRNTSYAHCGCRDCFELVINYTGKSYRCSDCREHGCNVDGGECRRPDAYDCGKYSSVLV